MPAPYDLLPLYQFHKHLYYPHYPQSMAFFHMLPLSAIKVL